MEIYLFMGCICTITGFISGLLGIGGGIIMAPLLLYMPPLIGLGPRKKINPNFLACGPVTCVPSADAYLDMHQRMRFADEPTAFAIWWIDYFRDP